MPPCLLLDQHGKLLPCIMAILPAPICRIHLLINVAPVLRYSTCEYGLVVAASTPARIGGQHCQTVLGNAQSINTYV